MRCDRPAGGHAGRWDVLALGRLPYLQAWQLQVERVAARAEGCVPDALLVCEHEPVVTTGRGTRADALLAQRFPVHAVERGGAATYHGPGQVVVYPIVALAPGRRDLRAWLASLEAACIEVLAGYGLAAGRRPGATGVWIAGERKLVSLGVAARRWVAWHGLALNHAPDLAHFEAIRPCGMPASVMTSMAAELGPDCPPREQVEAALVAALQRHLEPFRAPCHALADGAVS